jgi:hypothetical protein
MEWNLIIGLPILWSVVTHFSNKAGKTDINWFFTYVPGVLAIAVLAAFMIIGGMLA